MENAQQRADRLVGHLNGSKAAAPAENFIRRVVKGGKSGQPMQDAFVEALSERPKRLNKPKPPPNGPGHKGEQLKMDEISLADGFTPEGYVGPQQPRV